MGRLLAALALVAGLAACTVGSAPPDRFYRLTVAAPGALPRPALSGTVELGRIGAEGMTGERAMLYSYRNAPDQLLRYSYHFWTEAPPQLIQDGLVEFLRHAHAADAVVTSDLRVPPDYVIEGRLRRFELVAGDRPAVAVALDLGVVRLHGNQLLMLRNYTLEQPARSEDPADAVDAYQLAVDHIFVQFLDDLTRLSGPSQPARTP